MTSPTNHNFPSLTISLPDWVSRVLPAPDYVYETLEERMDLALQLARLNIEKKTGGPFGAVIFDMDSKKLVAPGVNIVVASNWSAGHAEMVAYGMAQQVLKTHDLGGPGMPKLELVTSTEPCAMCFGATPWAGVRHLVCGARDVDARAIGFDEGPKMDDWVTALESRCIKVTRDVRRGEALEVLESYENFGGLIYNGRRGEK